MKKLIFNIILLTLSLATCVAVSFSWFTVNEIAVAKPLTVETESRNFDWELYVYQNSTWNKTTSAFSLSPWNPTDKCFFRFDLTLGSDVKENLTINIKCGQVSSLISDELYVSDGKICIDDRLGNEYPLYSYTGSSVKVNQVNTDTLGDIIYDTDGITPTYTEKTLYNIGAGNALSLGDYKIEDVTLGYNCYSGLKSGSPATPSIPTGVTGVGITTGPIGTITLVPGSTYSIVLAFEYNDALSIIKTMNNYLTGGNSNCYSYQTLAIAAFYMTIEE